MKNYNILKSAFVFILSVFLFSCERERNSDGNLDQFRLTATFDSGESITFKQFNPDESDAGLLICNCVFYDDQMVIAFGADHYRDPSKSNGFDAGFSVDGVTTQRAFEFREENASATNTSTYVERIAPGLDGFKIYDNKENYRRSINGSGFCIREELPVDFQSIDVTRYSSENGGTIEGSFSINVYHEQDACATYEKERITGVFKLKRINFR